MESSSTEILKIVQVKTGVFPVKAGSKESPVTNGNVILDEAASEISMDEKMKAILTQEVIDKALETHWRGTGHNCQVCGRRTV